MPDHFGSYRKNRDDFSFISVAELSAHLLFSYKGERTKSSFFIFCGVSVDRHPRAYSIDTNCRGLSAYIMPAVCCAATEGSFMGL